MNALNQFRIRLVLLTMLVLCLPMAFADGNSVNAHLCKSELNSLRNSVTGGKFSNVGDCVSYAAQGGTLSSIKILGTPLGDDNLGFNVTLQGYGLAPNTLIQFHFFDTTSQSWLMAASGAPGFQALAADADGDVQGTENFFYFYCGVTGNKFEPVQFPNISQVYLTAQTAGGATIQSGTANLPCS